MGAKKDVFDLCGMCVLGGRNFYFKEPETQKPTLIKVWFYFPTFWINNWDVEIE